MDTLIRLRPRNSSLIARPGSNGFLRETSLPYPGEFSNICLWKANPSWCVPSRRLFSKSNNFIPWIKWNIYSELESIMCLDTCRLSYSAATSFSIVLYVHPQADCLVFLLHLNGERTFPRRGPVEWQTANTESRGCWPEQVPEGTASFSEGRDQWAPKS